MRDASVLKIRVYDKVRVRDIVAPSLIPRAVESPYVSVDSIAHETTLWVAVGARAPSVYFRSLASQAAF